MVHRRRRLVVALLIAVVVLAGAYAYVLRHQVTPMPFPEPIRPTPSASPVRQGSPGGYDRSLNDVIETRWAGA